MTVVIAGFEVLIGLLYLSFEVVVQYSQIRVKGIRKVHTCTGTEALYRPYGP